MDGVGTYCLDTVNNTWSSADEWTLLFYGKFEYVVQPLQRSGCWGLTTIDLSVMDDSQPLIVDS